MIHLGALSPVSLRGLLLQAGREERFVILLEEVLVLVVRLESETLQLLDLVGIGGAEDYLQVLQLFCLLVHLYFIS